MLYNIDFEIVAFVFLTVLYIHHKIHYTTRHILNKQFRELTLATLIMIATDILSAIGISYYDRIPTLLIKVLNGANFVSAALISYSFATYLRISIRKKNEKYVWKVNQVIYWFFLISSIVNLFVPFYFDFNSQGYVHGPLYLLQPTVTYYFMVYSAIVLIKYHKQLEKKEIITLGGYIFSILIFGVVQVFLTPYVLLTGVASGIALIIILFSLETPDYGKLLVTLDDLEKARTEAENAKAVAEAANHAKSEFLANMSHEIRTPINAIVGMNEMILRECEDPTIHEYAQNVDSAGETLLSIVNSILDFSKIESGKLELVLEDYELETMLKDVFQMISVRAEKKDIHFSYSIDGTLPSRVIGDSVRVSQILLNILNNAVKYTKEGSIVVQVTRESVEDEKVLMKFVCSDTGIGIREEDMGKLFQSFQRLELSKNKSIEGTGLGLVITKRLVDLMGGEISVESTYGKGTSFTVLLSQTVKDATSIDEKKASMDGKEIRINKNSTSFIAPKASVLVVDDIKMNISVIKGLLKRSQIQIDSAMSGAECIEKMKEKHYDVVLLDHMMPDMDGIETLQNIKAQGLDKENVIFVALTANAISGAREYYLRNGFADYLSKPVKSDLLEEKMMEYLQEYIESNV